MKTQMFIYSQQLLSNPKFALLVDYGWSITGNWVKNINSITKTTGSTGTLLQSDLLVPGVTYKLVIRVTNRTTGNFTIKNSSTGSTLATVSTNNLHTINFTADGTDVLITASSTFNGTIANATLVRTPDEYELDLHNEVDIPMNFNIDSIFKINVRKTAFSKSISLYGTHNNNKAFNHIYKLNGESLFNTNLYTPVVIKNSGIIVFKGNLCLNSVDEILQNGIRNIVYDVSVTGEDLDIWSLLGSLTIADLDFSEYDHLFSIERIKASWFNDITINGSNGQPNKTTSYTSSTITTEHNVVVSGVNHIGITFSSPHSFVAGDEVYVQPSSNYFSALWSFDQTVLSVPSSNSIILETTRSVAFSGTFNNRVLKQQFDGFGYFYPCVDYGTYIKNFFANGYKGGTGLLEIGESYIIKSIAGVDDFTNVGAVSNVNGEIFTATGTTPTTWADNGTVLIQLRDIFVDSDTLQPKMTGQFDESTDDYWEVYDFVPHIFLREVFMKMMDLIGFSYDCALFDSKIFRRLILPLNQTYSLNLFEGVSTISFNDNLPKIKLSDVLLAILNMFNLVFIQDKEDKTLLKFYNRGDFFNNTPIDWTNKLQTSQPLKIEMVNLDLPKTYQFKYKDSSDFYNVEYNRQFGNIGNEAGLLLSIDRRYGDYVNTVKSDFLTNENKTELVFEPSVSTGQSVLDAVTDMFITAAYGAEEGTGLSVKRNVINKLLIAGMRSLSSDSFSLVSINYSGDNVAFARAYPYAGHIDNHYQTIPTHDINFGAPLGIYFSSNSLLFPTNVMMDGWDVNSLYMKYWYKYINQITNRNSRIVTGVFKLSILDIYNLDFTKPVIVNDFVLKINQIKDWNINGSGLCECEFLLKV